MANRTPDRRPKTECPKYFSAIVCTVVLLAFLAGPFCILHSCFVRARRKNYKFLFG